MKAKKIFLFLLAVQLILCLSFPVAASEFDVSFAMEGKPSIVSSGETLDVVVSISENKGFLYADATFTYDSDVLTLTGTSVEDSEFTGVTTRQLSDNQIKIYIGNLLEAATGKTEAYTQTGVLVVFSFQVAEDYEGTADFSVITTKGSVMTTDKKFNYTIANAELGVNIVNEETHDCTAYEQTVLEAVPADCVNTGLTEGAQCSFCGKITTEQTEVAALGHTPSAVSCTEAQTCTVCQTVLAAAKGHTEVAVSGKPATCTEAGLTDGKKCSVCETVIVAQTEIAALGHTEVAVSGKAATCTEAGLTDGKNCSVCEAVIVAQEEIAALGHAYDNACDANCNTCDEARTPADHVYGEWTITKEATRKEEGAQERTCSVCNAKDVQAIEMITGMPVGVIIAIVVAGIAVIAVGAILVIKMKKRS